VKIESLPPVWRSFWRSSSVCLHGPWSLTVCSPRQEKWYSWLFSVVFLVFLPGRWSDLDARLGGRTPWYCVWLCVAYDVWQSSGLYIYCKVEREEEKTEQTVSAWWDFSDPVRVSTDEVPRMWRVVTRDGDSIANAMNPAVEGSPHVGTATRCTHTHRHRHPKQSRTRGGSSNKLRPASCCRVLPRGAFNGTILETLLVYAESFMATATTILQWCC